MAYLLLFTHGGTKNKKFDIFKEFCENAGCIPINFQEEVKKLANVKSAKKRILVAEKRQARNKHIKSLTKTAVKKAATAATAKSADSKTLLIQAISAIDKAVSKGIYHKNTAARKKSKLTKMVNKVAV